MIWLVTPKKNGKRQAMDGDNICLVKRNRELYSSLFYFGDEMKEYLEKHDGSPAGYNGPVYGHHFVVDLDVQTDPVDPSRAAVAMVPLLKKLDDLQIVHYLFSSGSKGFHLYIPKIYVEYPPELHDKWNMACQAFAIKLKEEYPELTEFIDESIYDKQRIFRYPFSIHPVSNKKKQALICFAPEIPHDVTVENIKQYFKPSSTDELKIIQEIFNGFYPGFTPDEVLFNITDCVLDGPEPVSQYREDRDEFGEGIISVSRYNAKECITKMMNTKNLKGQRHVIGLRISAHFMDDLGFSADMTRPVLQVWNNHLAEPMDEKAIEHILKYHGKYQFGCNDEVKKQFCDPRCAYYKFRDTQETHMFVGGLYFKRLEESVNAPTDFDIRYGAVYPDMISVTPTKPDRGHVVVVAAGPSVGKTTFMLNLMLRYKWIDWMFMSYEMSGEDIAEKMWINQFGNEKVNAARSAEFQQAINHIVTIDDPTIRLNDIPKIWKVIKGQTGKTCKAIVIDYLQLAPVGGSIATERAISVSKAAKEMAKELKVAVFLLSQVPKDLAGDGNVELPMQAPKDSGEITNLADLQLNLWRPYRNRPDLGEDNVMRISVAKNRHGEATQIIDLHYVAHEFRIEPYHSLELVKGGQAA